MNSIHIRRHSWILTLIAVWILPSTASVQITFERTYGDADNCYYGLDVQQTSDKGYIVAGYWELDSWGMYGSLLLKTDSLGARQWWRPEGVSLVCFSSSVRQTPDGGYIVGGSSGVTKTDALGQTVWNNDVGGVNCVRVAADNWYIAVSGLLFRLSPSGILYWAKDCGGIGVSVVQAADSGYVVTGYRGDSIYVMKTTPSGDSLWLRTYGEGVAYSIAKTQDGGYAVAGYRDGDMYLVRIDSLGDTVWTRTYGGSGWDLAQCVLETSYGGYVLTGWTYSFGSPGKLYLVETDSNGDTLYTRLYGGDSGSIGTAADLTSDGGYIITGELDCDTYLVKTDGKGLTGVIGERYRRAGAIRRMVLLNHPNPFRHSTLISYTLPQTAQVTVVIYDITGRLVETLVNSTQKPAFYQVRWNRKDNPSGVYFCRLRAEDFVETRKMVVVE